MSKKKSRLESHRSTRRRRKLFDKRDNLNKNFIKVKSVNTVQNEIIIVSTPKIKRAVTQFDSPSQSTPYKSPFCKKLKFSSPSPKISTHDDFWSKDAESPQHAPGNYLMEELGLQEITENDTIDFEIGHDSICDNDSTVKCLIDLTPRVVEELQKEGFAEVLLKFFELIVSKKFPLDNIAFLLWTEVIEWFHQENTSGMRYMKRTKQFWKLGMRLFGGKFIRFMSGYKNTSDVLYGESTPGYFDPSNSDINFAVPSVDVLRDYTHYNDCSGKRLPGIFPDVIRKVSQSMKEQSMCISFDGKKLKQGLTADSGDIDLIGFEEGLTLQQRKEEICQLVKALETNIKLLKPFEEETMMESIPVDMREDVIKELQVFLEVLSSSAEVVRNIKVKKEYAKSKFIERGGPDWRNGKFVYVISAINAYLYDIDRYLKLHSDLVNQLCLHLAHLNSSESLFTLGRNVDLYHQSNCNLLPDNIDGNDDTRKIKQRSEEWHRIRKQAKVTGSTLHKAIGLENLSNMREHFDTRVCNLKEAPRTQFTIDAMQHGTDNEVNAMSTLVGKILPSLFPDMKYYEEGCFRLFGGFMVVSPDGTIGNSSDTSGRVGIEFKCPVRGAHRSVPERYYLQCLATMYATDAQKLLFISWDENITTVFEVSRNDNVLFKALVIAEKLYGTEKPKRPTRLPEELPNLKSDIKIGVANCSFRGEFQSTTVIKYTDRPPENSSLTFIDINPKSLNLLHKQILDIVRESYELRREKASEAVVFLLFDLNRNWSKNQLKWAPICWFPKGYSLTCKVMRDIAESVLDECKKQGLHVPSIAFDGQWHNIAFRSKTEEPLTRLQLHKDVWKSSEKTSKTEIIKEFSGLNKIPRWNKENVIIVAYYGERLPSTHCGFKTETHKSKKSNTADGNERLEETVSLDEVVPDSVLSTDPFGDSFCEEVDKPDHIDEILKHITLDTEAATEIVTCPIDDEAWTRELLCISDQTSGQSDNNVATEESSVTPSAVQQTMPLLSPTSLELDTLLRMLRADQHTNAKGHWDKRGSNVLKDHLSSSEKIKLFRDADLKVVIRFLNRHIKTNSVVLDMKLKESDKKYIKFQKLCKILGYDSKTVEWKQRKTGNQTKMVQNLNDICIKVLQTKVPKKVLNIAHSQYHWRDQLSKWERVSSVPNTVKLLENEPEYWFYHPEYSESRQQIEVKCIDSTHLLTRTRRKCCKGGLDNLSNDPWMKVARGRKTLLSSVMIEDIIEPMSVSMAITNFSEAVENVMIENGDLEAASLCHDIRKWWSAEDDPGISAIERIKMRTALRTRLLSHINWDTFPSPTMHITGWPIQLWEAIIANIDAKALLYAICKDGTYNVRSFSSMMGETFFSELSNLDKRGQGTVTTTEFSQFIENSIDQMQTRLDPDRCFAYRTSVSTVYKPVEKYTTNSEVVNSYNADISSRTIISVSPKDHFFDNISRTRVAGKNKEGRIDRDRNAILKGTLGVRWEKARRNEGKMMLTKKMGIE